jgi:hypothetical protein
MNVELPFGLREHPAFWLILGLGAVSMVGFLIRFGLHAYTLINTELIKRFATLALTPQK